MFHGVLLCSMSKTLHRRQKNPLLSAQSVCDAGIVHLHHTELLTEQMGEEDVESSENVKKTWSRLLQLGISRCRGCTAICTRNLHQSELQQQPNRHLKVVGEVGATGLVLCRAAGCISGFFFLGEISDGSLTSVGPRAADRGSACQTWWNGFVLSFVWPGRQPLLLSLCFDIISFQKLSWYRGGNLTFF